MMIPIVSLGTVSMSSEEDGDWQVTASQFGQALARMGFVYLSHHGISEDKIRKVFMESLKFFELEESQKIKYGRDFKTTFHGYTQMGGELMNLETNLELREMFDVALASAAGADCGGKFSENCPFPDEEVPKFRLAVTDLMRECKAVVFKLLKLLALSLHLEDTTFFIKCHTNMDDSTIPNFTQLRTLHYPSVADTAKLVNPQTVRCAAHTDYGSITLLFQDSVGGLEIQQADGSWIQAEPIPGCILMNVGDLMHIWSGGKFPSTVHRVMLRDHDEKANDKAKRARQSIALFVKPDSNTLVRPLKGKPETEKMRAGDHYLPHETLAGDHFYKRTLYHRKMAESVQ